MSIRITVCVVAIGGVLGCARIVSESAWTPPARFERDGWRTDPAAVGASTTAAPRAAEPTGVLTLQRAVEVALARNPELAAVSWGVGAAEARVAQAALRPNPELELEIEEFGGSGEASGFDAAATTLAVGQEIELGGKRAKRTEVARIERRLAAWDREAKRLDVIAEVSAAFVEVVAAQEMVGVAGENATLAERTLEVAAERVAAGKVPEIEEVQARVEFASSRIELARAGRALVMAREALAETWGADEPAFSAAAGDLAATREVPRLGELLSLARRGPEIARLADEVALREAELAAERAEATPNLGVSVGVQRFEESGDTAFMVGVAIPLPVSDRNQGGIAAAERELSGALEERRASVVAATAAVRRAHHRLASAHEEAEGLRSEVLPAARKAFDAAEEGYRGGKFGHLAVIEAQRALSDARAQYVEAAAERRLAAIEVERLAGLKIESTVDAMVGTVPGASSPDVGPAPRAGPGASSP
ncbi:MAG: TolC family protein, partial [Planctomycetota bacterium]